MPPDAAVAGNGDDASDVRLVEEDDKDGNRRVRRRATAPKPLLTKPLLYVNLPFSAISIIASYILGKFSENGCGGINSRIHLVNPETYGATLGSSRIPRGIRSSRN
ncbi:hypothetical protein KM043_006974 [Ampulex compressa]|nr:hypothetical protein KM043_006974 [Ampulex compressa]